MNITIIGGGMITKDLLLPSIYHLQRTGMVEKIAVCALDSAPVRALKESVVFREAFPGQDIEVHPAQTEDPRRKFPQLYREVLAEMPARQAVVVAIPDQSHYEVVKEALRCDQHVLCVKPLVLRFEQAVEIEKLAYEKGLFVGVEYHKRFDRRSLIAQRDYERGNFGEFRMGEATMIEPYYYRSSNFQNWFTCDKTDPFTYVGCHYVDLVQFITRLRPVEVSVSGIKGKFPNGNEGYLWANGRVIYENGAVLSVTDGLGYPDQAAGGNEQCLVMYCEGEGKTGMIAHDDQFRGVEHSYLSGIGRAGSVFHSINPDFFWLVPWEGLGCKPIGYGFDSVAAILGTIHRIEREVAGLEREASLARRRELIREVDRKRIIATPANSSTNELVVEAARLSILNGGQWAKIVYGEKTRAELRN
jgi:predicted dehydrogenase